MIVSAKNFTWVAQVAVSASTSNVALSSLIGRTCAAI